MYCSKLLGMYTGMCCVNVLEYLLLLYSIGVCCSDTLVCVVTVVVIYWCVYGGDFIDVSVCVKLLFNCGNVYYIISA